MRTDLVTQTPRTPPPPPLSQAGQGLGAAIKEAVGGALQEVSSEMSKELANAQRQRDVLQSRLDVATSASEKASLTKQIAQADVNIAKLEAAVAKLDSKAGDLTAGRAGPLTSTSTSTQPPFFPPSDPVPETMIIATTSIVFIGFPLAIAFARLLWKRANAVQPTSTQQLPADSTRRFDELSHSVDAIAIEVERISENQRYLTKLLSEPRQNAAVGAGRSGAPPAS